jgi:ABC-type nitrate/sulfonate/bicarbonate transport system substrate-binding protein
MNNLKVIVFEGVQNLPIFAAEAQGYFKNEGLNIDLTFTPNSWTLRDGLKDGLFDIAHTAVDNAVAMVDTANADVAVFMGGDNGFNGLFVQPEIKGIDDLRGKTVLVDAPNTAFALALYKILSLHSMELDSKDYEALSIGATPFRLKAMLENKSYAGAILNLPFRLQALKSGLVHLGDLVDFLGPYLSTAGFVMRGWAQHNEDALISYIKAYVQGLRWVLNPANKVAVIDLLQTQLKLERDVAMGAVEMATSSAGGFKVDAHIDIEGFANVLAIRAAFEKKSTPQQVQRYIDTRYHALALHQL